MSHDNNPQTKSIPLSDLMEIVPCREVAQHRYCQLFHGGCFPIMHEDVDWMWHGGIPIDDGICVKRKP